ncbi:MAG: anthranilate phosphoribosyltransferase, partial [Burkholderiaceae bacterium]|nr:anthranilate phosphoribosyltransferase [Burkholderiaceae bacterium]
GLDEIALHGETMVGELKFGHVQHYSITAQQFGFPSYSVQECDAALRAASPQESESKLKSALDNEIGPARDIVALNAAGALLASNVVSDWPTAVDLAMKTIASGAAKAKLARFISVSQSLAA